jgi:hypothetical protein
MMVASFFKALAMAAVLGAARAQTVCDAGFYLETLTNGAVLCAQCVPGTYNPASGATACSPCKAGSYSAWGAQACAPCPGGHYANSAGAKECTACAPGKYSEFTGQTGECEVKSAQTTADTHSCHCTLVSALL